jgi:tetratricopeptide (TPR) repeat protein
MLLLVFIGIFNAMPVVSGFKSEFCLSALYVSKLLNLGRSAVFCTFTLIFAFLAGQLALSAQQTKTPANSKSTSRKTTASSKSSSANKAQTAKSPKQESAKNGSKSSANASKKSNTASSAAQTKISKNRTAANKTTAAGKNSTKGNSDKKTASNQKSGAKSYSAAKSSKSGSSPNDKSKARNTSSSTKSESAADLSKKPLPESDDEAELNKILSVIDPQEKAEKLVKFIAQFPKSKNLLRAKDSLAAARAAIADNELSNGNLDQALRMFSLAIDEAQNPFSEKLYKEVISTIPPNLYWRGERIPALEFARKIEDAVGDNSEQLVEIAKFYNSIEYPSETIRICDKAIAANPANTEAFITLGIARQMNFDLEASEAAFGKAAEAASTSSTRILLADTLRARGKLDEAIRIYREIIAAEPDNTRAAGGLALSLLWNGSKEEGEALLKKVVDSGSNDPVLFASVSFWYSENGDPTAGKDFAQKALAINKNFLWANLALAHALRKSGSPVDAERLLFTVWRNSAFPTLIYEIAAARYEAGFYREAAEVLNESFHLKEDKIIARLGGRVETSADSFQQLVAKEIRAGLMIPFPDSSKTDSKLLNLARLVEKAKEKDPDTKAIESLVNDFTADEDETSTFRKLYAAEFLGGHQLLPELALSLTAAATEGADQALQASSSASAIMASELYDARKTAFSRNDFLLIPNVPKSILSSIYRGKIEEAAGIALLSKSDPVSAEIRFRRALTVYPKDSAWWRSAMWNLGEALSRQEKFDQALTSFIQSYKTDRPDLGKYMKISQLYAKVNGSTEGLEKEIGPMPIQNLPGTKEENSGEKIEENTANNKEQTEKKSSDQSMPKSEDAASSEIKQVTASTTEDSASQNVSIAKAGDNNKIQDKSREGNPDALNIKLDNKSDAQKNPANKASDTSVTDSIQAVSEPVSNNNEKKDTVSGQVASKNQPELNEPTSDLSAPTETKKEQPPPAESEKAEKISKSDDGSTRPRVVSGKDIRLITETPCNFELSQQEISLLRDGGSLGVMLVYDPTLSLDELKIEISDPKELEAEVEKNMTNEKGRSVIIIRSKTNNAGEHTIRFIFPCGTKELLVKIR